MCYFCHETETGAHNAHTHNAFDYVHRLLYFRMPFLLMPDRTKRTFLSKIHQFDVLHYKNIYNRQRKCLHQCFKELCIHMRVSKYNKYMQIQMPTHKHSRTLASDNASSWPQ